MGALTTTTNRVTFTGNGSQTSFTIPFLFYAISDLLVYLVDTTTNTATLQTEGSSNDYTVTGAADDDGGIVEMLTAPSATEELIVLREVDATQESAYSNYNRLPATTVERGLNRLVMMVQQIIEKLGRHIGFGVAVSSIGDIPDPVGDTVIGFNSDGTEFELKVMGDTTFTFPTSGFLISDGSNVLVSRELEITGDLAITNPAGAAGNPNIDSSVIDAKIVVLEALRAFFPSEQATPDDTVLVTGGIIRDPGGIGQGTTVAANGASGNAFPVVTSDSRIDLLVEDYAGAYSIVSGTQAASPVAPNYPRNKLVICEVLIDETTDVIINDADITPVLQNVNSMTVAGSVISGTRAMSAGSGTQQITHGLTGPDGSARKPKRITAHFVNDQFNGGTCSGSCVILDTTFVQGCNAYDNASSTGKGMVQSGALLYAQDNGGVDTYTGAIDAADELTVDLTFTAVNVVTGNLDYILIFE